MIMHDNKGAVTIFEGPDGAGKTTAAVEYARMTGAAYFHHGPYKSVGDSLCRMVFDTMLPALLGYQDVVIDRCWLSDPIYGRVFRGGENRVIKARRRVMERIALSCGAVLVNCRPEWRYVEESFISRSSEELLDNTEQLRQVYDAYENLETDLSEVVFDWTLRRNESRERVLKELHNDVATLAVSPQPRGDFINGSSRGRVLIVGNTFSDHDDIDSFFQLPFSSLGTNSVNLWLSDQLEKASISEQYLTWANADTIQIPAEGFDKPVIALGIEAYKNLKSVGVESRLVPSPSHWMIMSKDEPHPLIAAIKEVIYE